MSEVLPLEAYIPLFETKAARVFLELLDRGEATIENQNEIPF